MGTRRMTGTTRMPDCHRSIESTCSILIMETMRQRASQNLWGRMIAIRDRVPSHAKSYYREGKKASRSKALSGIFFMAPRSR